VARRIPEWGQSARGEIQPMRQERRHCGGEQGRASVTCSPDSGGFHFLIGVIDTAWLLRYFSVYPKSPFKIPIPQFKSLQQAGEFEGGKLSFVPSIPIRQGRPMWPTWKINESIRFKVAGAMFVLAVMGGFSTILGTFGYLFYLAL